MVVLPHRDGAAKKALSISVGYYELVEGLEKLHPSPSGEWKGYRLKNSHKDSLTLRELLVGESVLIET